MPKKSKWSLRTTTPKFTNPHCFSLRHLQLWWPVSLLIKSWNLRLLVPNFVYHNSLKSCLQTLLQADFTSKNVILTSTKTPCFTSPPLDSYIFSLPLGLYFILLVKGALSSSNYASPPPFLLLFTSLPPKLVFKWQISLFLLPPLPLYLFF